MELYVWREGMAVGKGGGGVTSEVMRVVEGRKSCTEQCKEKFRKGEGLGMGWGGRRCWVEGIRMEVEESGRRWVEGVG